MKFVVIVPELITYGNFVKKCKYASKVKQNINAKLLKPEEWAPSGGVVYHTAKKMWPGGPPRCGLRKQRHTGLCDT